MATPLVAQNLRVGMKVMSQMLLANCDIFRLTVTNPMSENDAMSDVAHAKMICNDHALMCLKFCLKQTKDQ